MKDISGTQTETDRERERTDLGEVLFRKRLNMDALRILQVLGGGGVIVSDCYRVRILGIEPSSSGDVFDWYSSALSG